MANLDPGAVLARLVDACARVRAAARPDDVLDATAEEGRVLSGSRHAWAARVENAETAPRVAMLRSSSDDDAGGAEPTPPPVAALVAEINHARGAFRPLARSGGFLAVALLGSHDAAEGILVVEDTTDGHAVLDLAMTQLGTAAGLALEGARLRARVETVTRARESLLASVSHDLRNPLNTFAMSAGLLRDDLERNDVDATRGISLVSRMERATARMQGLIEDLVEASRIDAKKIDYAIRPESAAQIVKDAAAAAKNAASDKGAAVACETLDEDARVMVDRARTLQLISKVVAFEAKSTGDGGTIRLGVARQGDDTVVFTARALGPGGVPVPPPEEGRGGLALLLARGLVEAQQGTFRIDASDGFVVVFTLPAAKA
ncbi:MAG: Sensory box histidine kinase [Labilithrix sp.]|nr:Sensory box histidine kinase [Labilithrix sp.]